MKQIKIGIFGLNRGGEYISSLLANNADIVAICDKEDYWLNKAQEKLGIKEKKEWESDDIFLTEEEEAQK